ncbi:CoA ester lyase [Halorussus salilacus]|uniref:HpcH/HpaI aldolase/citrate lyase family protein n=1 Tax=Halorussus salilacus TaxID=2953750 RepID=UPI0020A22BBF|nr:CoA ester lyase [Halorussus salilacus]USZ69604.1 CoA ester lyase [Halorussus salilacus]
MTTTVRRSALFTPADQRSMMEKAADTDADALTFDLEDAVAPDRKGLARENLVAVLDEVDFGATEVGTRINAVGTDHWREDVDAAVAAGVDAVAVPMVESVEGVETLLGALDDATDDPPAVRLGFESPAGVFAADDIARRVEDAPEVVGMSFGIADYCREIGAPDISARVREFLEHRIRGCAALGGLDAFASPHLDVDDEEGLRERAESARELGYAGMSAIHPGQLATINEVFTPSDERVAQARRLVRAFDDSDSDSLLVEGVFLDTATVDRYRDVVAVAERIESDH